MNDFLKIGLKVVWDLSWWLNHRLSMGFRWKCTGLAFNFPRPVKTSSYFDRILATDCWYLFLRLSKSLLQTWFWLLWLEIALTWLGGSLKEIIPKDSASLQEIRLQGLPWRSLLPMTIHVAFCVVIFLMVSRVICPFRVMIALPYGCKVTGVWKILLIYFGTLLSRRILTSAPVSMSAWIFAFPRLISAFLWLHEMVWIFLRDSCLMDVIVETPFTIFKQTAEKWSFLPQALQKAFLDAQFGSRSQLLLPQPAQHIIFFAPWGGLKLSWKFSLLWTFWEYLPPLFPILFSCVCWGSSFSTQLMWKELLGDSESINLVASSVASIFLAVEINEAKSCSFSSAFSLILAMLVPVIIWSLIKVLWIWSFSVQDVFVHLKAHLSACWQILLIKASIFSFARAGGIDNEGVPGFGLAGIYHEAFVPYHQN